MVVAVVVVEGLKFYTSVEEKCVIRRNGPGYFPPPPYTHPRPSPTLRSQLFTMLLSNLKALKFIRSFFVTERSRLSRILPHRLLLSSVDPLLRLQGGNHPEIFRRSKNGEPSVFWLFHFPFKSTARRDSARSVDGARGFRDEFLTN